MDNYLEQFKKLPYELQEAVSSEEKVKLLEEIEKKYNLPLAKLVVRLMIKDIAWSESEKFCQENFGLSPEKAAELKKDLAEKIFNEVIDYLTKESEVKSEKQPEREEEMEIGKDELELAKAVEEVKTVPKPELEIKGYGLNPDEIIKEVKEKTGLSFMEEILEKRFTNICLNFLKEIRKDFETEEILTRPEKIGGLGLVPEKAKEIMNLLKEFKVKFYGPREATSLAQTMEKKPGLAEGFLTPAEIIKGSIVEEIPLEEPKPESEKVKELIPPSIAKLMDTPEPDQETKIDEKLKQKFNGGTIVPSFPELETPIQPVATREESEIKKEKFEEMPLTETVEEVPIQIKRPLSEEKIVEDVSSYPKALGPVEEIKEMTLMDLKRWGGQQTCQIILNKINLLAEESLTKKAEAIQAWQKSPLYHLYLEIGEEALSKKKSVEEVIEERLAQGRETMSLADFERIAELNRKLRF
ncbi:MAG: hypothetical protein N2259_02960 [Patescibacteria group bacterium]|nr:hypothetical protein [Patescibacteria group bacterium]